MRLAISFWLSIASAVLVAAQATPKMPGFDYLFTVNITMGLSIAIGSGPKDTTRGVFPVSGGKFAGPKLNGKVLTIGADWAYYDQKSYFASDARYQLQTVDGGDISVSHKGSSMPDGLTHIIAKFDTVNGTFAWLNDVTAVGMLRQMGWGYMVDMWELKSPAA